MLELPPRARRIPPDQRTAGTARGTTSACAENTACGGVAFQIKGNYLRVRGEYRLRGCGFPDQGELPPRARRIRFI